VKFSATASPVQSQNTTRSQIQNNKMGKKSKRSNRKASPESSDHQFEFQVGELVTLRGLQSAQYNGKQGTVFSLPTKPDCPNRRYGVIPEGHDLPIAVRPSNIVSAPPTGPIAPHLGHLGQRTGYVTTLQMRNERNLMLEAASADQMAMMRMMMSMFLTEEKQIEAFGRKIEPLPNFWHEVLFDHDVLPEDVDRQWAGRYLRTAFQQTCDLPHLMELHIKRKEYSPSGMDLIRRLGNNDPTKVEWYSKQLRQPGDIFPQTMHPYTTLTRHSFSNQAYRKEFLFLGTTHVAVGFVDLGILFAATLGNAPSAKNGPLHFIGIDMSSYAVAKSLVIWEMLKDTPTKAIGHDRHCQAIMQVWYSATWRKVTDVIVKSALTRLLRSSLQKTFDPKVAAILEHWSKSSDVPLKEVRLQWSKNRAFDGSDIAHMERKEDMIAMARYELTGDFGVGHHAWTGNILMFNCPDGTPPLQPDESVFSAFGFHELAPLLSSRKDIIQAAEEYALAHISKLAEWARDGLVTAEFICAKVEDMVKEIAVERPWTMSWSNVIDYIDHADFHRLARTCSRHGNTIHFAYSMNWSEDVFGACIMDYLGKDKECTKARSDIVDLANKSAEFQYTSLGWDKYLRLPPPCNPLNTTAHHCLEINCYRAWADYFFAIGQQNGPCNMANLEHVLGSPLTKTGASTIAFTWTYDKDIRFNARDG
jgi:hypothetical protein